jgi:hypothetical protein
MTLLKPTFLPSTLQTFAGVRHMVAKTGVRQGVPGYADYRVTQRAAGADRSLDVAAGDAFVAPQAGNPGTRRGLYHTPNDGVVNAPSTANAGNPRVVRLFLKINDPAFDASSEPELLVRAGSSVAGATLDNAAGTTSRNAIVVPPVSMPLAEWLEGNGYTQILDAGLRDLRPWSRGEMTFPLGGLAAFTVYSDLNGDADEEWAVSFTGKLLQLGVLRNISLRPNRLAGANDYGYGLVDTSEGNVPTRLASADSGMVFAISPSTSDPTMNTRGTINTKSGRMRMLNWQGGGVIGSGGAWRVDSGISWLYDTAPILTSLQILLLPAAAGVVFASASYLTVRKPVRL